MKFIGLLLSLVVADMSSYDHFVQYDCTILGTPRRRYSSVLVGTAAVVLHVNVEVLKLFARFITDHI